jgi:23S rRNA pseudouridine2605 synthase
MRQKKISRKKMRLNKFIAESGITSRRKAEELIIQSRITVNSRTVTNLAHKIDPQKDEIMLDGEILTIRKHLYYLMNKPAGVVTTTSDEKKRKTVLDLVRTGERIYPVGRLDYNTTGVLFLTNDGDFSQLLTHPGNKIPREYDVKLDKSLNRDDSEKLLKGIYIKGVKGRFIKISKSVKNDFNQVRVKAVEGRNHFVKNMFGALGYKVIALNRVSYAGIRADIGKGEYRKLTDKEIKEIKNKYGK